MTPTAQVSIEEYLTTDYSPDCDYVNGAVEERNVGERDHSRLQGLFIALLWRFESLGLEILPEQRVQVSARRYRIPDVCVLRPGHPWERIVTHAPFICIEILSREDRIGRVQKRIDDYLEMGVPYVWMIDPIQKRGWRCLLGQTLEVKDTLRTEDPEIVITLAELFP